MNLTWVTKIHSVHIGRPIRASCSTGLGLQLQNVPTVWQRLGILACVQFKLFTAAEGSDWSRPTAGHLLCCSMTACDMGFWRLSLEEKKHVTR